MRNSTRSNEGTEDETNESTVESGVVWRPPPVKKGISIAGAPMVTR